MLSSFNRAVFFVFLSIVIFWGMFVPDSFSQNLEDGTDSCLPGTGWSLSYLPLSPDAIAEIEQTLASQGLEAAVTGLEVGETDSCGDFLLQATDLKIEIVQPTEMMQEQILEIIYQATTVDVATKVGIIEVRFNPTAEPQFMRYNPVKDALSLSTERAPLISTVHSSNIVSTPADFGAMTAVPATEIFNQDVLVVVYDPLLDNGQRLSDFLGWNDHEDLTAGTINHFSQSSNNRLNYTVVETIIVDTWPEKTDGFIYTEEEYLAVYNGQATSHQPDNVDYNAIVNDPQLDICGKANRGEIDEVWIYNGPWFGFWESTLVGPGAYWYNSNPVPGPYTCTELVPIMGPSPERGLESAVHNFGHRTESTMRQVYGSWEQNRIVHSWEAFALVDALSPDFVYSGCGNTHYPPNGLSDYDYGNAGSALTNCDDFWNYPELSNPSDVWQTVSCADWGCNEVGYQNYWYSRFPANDECGVDDVANDWWQYFVHPELANDPSSICLEPATPTPTATSMATPTNTPTVTNTPTPTYTVTSTPIPTEVIPTMTPTLVSDSGGGLFVYLPFVQK